MDEKLILNDGTELEGHVIETEIRLFFYVQGKTLEEIFNLFIDPDKTSVIRAERYGEIATYRRYTHLMSVSEETGGMVSGALKKG